MRVSKSWLNDYVDCAELTSEQFYELITTKVAEVDAVIAAGELAGAAVVARVKSVKAHPGRDTLKVVEVELGGKTATVVCGAPNCVEGMLTAYLAPGAKVADPATGAVRDVEAREIAGVKSEGILVSEAELGLTGDHSGLIVFGDDAVPGKSVTPLVGEPDTILEIDNKSLTHRPDLWCHLGFARELSAILGKKLKTSPDRWADDVESGAKLLAALGSGKSKFTIKVEAATKSKRFTAIEIDGVKVEKSPLWLRRRLSSVGGGVRNLLVDLSNYVMHDIGQPNHVYDAEMLKGTTVTTRMAKASEKFTGLDGVERELTVEDVVIADEERAVALGGVMGGQASSVNDGTKKLLLEAAHFDPVVIRLTTKRHAVRTDASNRFEKSRSPYSPPLALHRYTELLCQLQPGAKISSAVTEDFVERPKTVVVSASCEYIRGRLDEKITDAEIKGILTSLGFGLTEKGADAFEVTVPYERAARDISIQDDLVEEVGRIYGYGNITEVSPRIQSLPQEMNPVTDLETRVRDRLSGIGFSEVYLYSFMSDEKATRLGYDTSKSVQMLNSIDSNSDRVRTTLVPGLIEAVERNARYSESAYLFEIGRGYRTERDAAHEARGIPVLAKAAAHERRLLALTVMSGRDEKGRAKAFEVPAEVGAEFYAAAAVVRRVVDLVTRSKVELSPVVDAGAVSDEGNYAACKKWMHPYRAATISVDGLKVGVVAELNPTMGFELKHRAAVAEIDLQLLLSVAKGVTLFKPLPKFPDSFFEMSVVMPERAPYRTLESLLETSVEKSVLRRVELLDVYQGAPLKADEKSVSVRLVFGADDRTLAGDEITAMQNALLKAVEGKEGFGLRK